jgi:hypothetical protein
MNSVKKSIDKKEVKKGMKLIFKIKRKSSSVGVVV